MVSIYRWSNRTVIQARIKKKVKAHTQYITLIFASKHTSTSNSILDKLPESPTACHQRLQRKKVRSLVQLGQYHEVNTADGLRYRDAASFQQIWRNTLRKNSESCIIIAHISRYTCSTNRPLISRRVLQVPPCTLPIVFSLGPACPVTLSTRSVYRLSLICWDQQKLSRRSLFQKYHRMATKTQLPRQLTSVAINNHGFFPRKTTQAQYLASVL